MFADFVVAVQHPHEMTVIAHLQRGGRDDYRILLGINQHTGVDELVREQRVVLVVETGLQFDGAGGGVNLDVEAQQRSVALLLFVGEMPGIDRQRFNRCLRGNHRGDIVFRQGEDEIDRMRLGQHHDTGGVTAGDLVADIHLF